MYLYNRLLVILNLNDQDRTTISYAAMISRMAQTEEMYFLHVTRNQDIPETLANEYPDLLPPVNEFARAKVKEIVGAYFDGNPECRKIYRTGEELFLTQVLNLIRKKKIDLVLTGHSVDPNLNGLLPLNIARMAPCEVLIVPEAAGSQIKSIMVPVDFSEISADAVGVAADLALDLQVQEISLLHVSRVPASYHKTQKTYEAFGKIMKMHAQKSYMEFIENCQLRSVKTSALFKLGPDLSRIVNMAVYERGIDLIVIGVRGATDDPATLVGSVAEQVIRTARIPLMVVKKRHRLEAFDPLQS